MDDEENNRVIQEAKRNFSKVKILTHWTKEYKQIFVAQRYE